MRTVQVVLGTGIAPEITPQDWVVEIDDEVSAAETVSTTSAVSWTRSIADNAPVVDVLLPIVQTTVIHRDISDPVAVNDSFAFQRQVTVNDNAGVTDPRGVRRGVTKTDNVGVTDTGITVYNGPPIEAGVTMMMGCSTSANSHGGTEVWEGWRTYSESELYTYCNRTGSQRPKFMAYSEDGGQNLGGASPNYASVRSHALDVLNEFYYGGTGQTPHPNRWGIKLYWSNGNENADKGAITLPHSTTKINNYVISQQGLYDACHYIDPVTSARRFPDAYAGSNPTQNHEDQGIIADWLHPSARYHDFVMWSMYPPGRSSTTADPTYNWPTFSESEMYTPPSLNRSLGFLTRCFYRTFQAQAQARADTGNSNFKLAIGCGEVGIGDNPADSTTRPYYAVHGLAGGMQKLADQYELDMPFACWWDHQSDAAAPQNILSDEPSTTNPSTRQAWQNWRSYNHEFGGTHPASWAGNPKPSWNTTGPVT